MASWDDTEKQYNENRNKGSKFLKFENDGDRAELVFLSPPEPVEKEGSDGSTWTAYVVEVWNLEGGKEGTGGKQTWDMGASPFKALLGLKRAIGVQRLESSVVAVVRNGAKGDTKTSYTMIPLGEVPADLAGQISAATGVVVRSAPAQVQAPRQQAQAPAQRPAQAPAQAPAPGFFGPDLTAIHAAPDLVALNAAVGVAWEQAVDQADQDSVMAAAKARKAALAAPAPAPAQAPAKRAPTF
jgi:hypothetical protein